MAATFLTRFSPDFGRARSERPAVDVDDAVLVPDEPPPSERPMPFLVEVAEAGEVLFSQAFEAGTFVVGASPDADIIITDLDEPEIATVRLETVGSACLVTVTALAPGVSARGRELALGKPVLFPERARFIVADAYVFEIAFTPPKRAVVVDRSALPSLLVVGGLILGGIGFLTSGGFTGGPAPQPASEAAAVVPQAAAPLRPAALPAPPTASVAPEIRLGEAERMLRLAFTAANLVPQLRVSSDAVRLIVEGDVTPQERDRAVDVIGSFRERHGTPIELALASDARDADFYASVVLMPEPYLIAEDGRRYGPDQRLPDGARVVSIDEDGIVLERDGLRQRIAYGL